MKWGSGARALTGGRSHRRQVAIGFTVLAFVVSSSSLLAAQAEPCAEQETEGCDARRWRLPRPEPASMPAPPPRIAPTPGDGKPWSSMLARERHPPAAPISRRWYGWQTLIADGVAIGSILLLEEISIAVGSVVAVIGSPIVHFANGHTFGGTVSFAMRGAAAGLIGVGILIANENIVDNDEEETVSTGLAITGVVGFAVALGVDAFVLGYAEPDPSESLALVPWVDPKRGITGVRFALAL